MADLSRYKITFFKHPLFGVWSYKIVTPSGEIISPIVPCWAHKQGAEVDALRHIERHIDGTYSLTGDELKEKVDGNE